MQKNIIGKLKPTEINGFIPIGRNVCRICRESVPVLYNKICSECLKKQKQKLGDF